MPQIKLTIEDEIRADTLHENGPSTNKGSKVELSEENIMKDKKPEEDATLDCNEFPDLWDGKHHKNQLSKNIRNELIRERMLKKEVPKVEVNLECNEFQDLWNAKTPEDQLSKKEKNEMIKKRC